MRLLFQPPPQWLVVSLWLLLSHGKIWSMASFQCPRIAKSFPSPRMSTRTTMIRFVEHEYGVYQDGTLEILRKESSSMFQLYYRIYNPTGRRTPLVILHGGPSLPSQYLYPLVDMVSVDRPVIFYDQLGCGRSDEPKDLSCYSIALSLLDLNFVVDYTLSKILISRASMGSETGQQECRHFHLFGHSYGGSLAYEYVKSQVAPAEGASLSSQPPSFPTPPANKATCRSLILCNAIQNMQRSNDDYDFLHDENPKGFWTQHACREGIPPPLQDALDHMGTTWNGMSSILDYVATPILPTSTPNKLPSTNLPHTLLISCGRDFAYRASNEKAWKPLLTGVEVEFADFANCAHYPFYEEKRKFGRLLEGYLERMDSR